MKEEHPETPDGPKVLQRYGARMYFCHRCGKKHRTSSRIGREHHPSGSVGPVGDPPKDSKGEQRVYDLVFDRSGSMRDILGVAREAALEFLEKTLSGNDLVGLRPFSTAPCVVVPIREWEDNAGSVRERIAELTAEGKTPLYDAIARSAEAVAEHRDASEHWVIVVTDGRENASTDFHTVEQVLEHARNLDIEVRFLLFGIGDDVDADALGALAGGTGGTFVPVPRTPGDIRGGIGGAGGVVSGPPVDGGVGGRSGGMGPDTSGGGKAQPGWGRGPGNGPTVGPGTGGPRVGEWPAGSPGTEHGGGRPSPPSQPVARPSPGRSEERPLEKPTVEEPAPDICGEDVEPWDDDDDIDSYDAYEEDMMMDELDDDEVLGVAFDGDTLFDLYGDIDDSLRHRVLRRVAMVEFRLSHEVGVVSGTVKVPVHEIEEDDLGDYLLIFPPGRTVEKDHRLLALIQEACLRYRKRNASRMEEMERPDFYRMTQWTGPLVRFVDETTFMGIMAGADRLDDQGRPEINPVLRGSGIYVLRPREDSIAWAIVLEFLLTMEAVNALIYYNTRRGTANEEVEGLNLVFVAALALWTYRMESWRRLGKVGIDGLRGVPIWLVNAFPDRAGRIIEVLTRPELVRCMVERKELPFREWEELAKEMLGKAGVP